jgi:hypothetical protein
VLSADAPAAGADWAVTYIVLIYAVIFFFFVSLFFSLDF